MRIYLVDDNNKIYESNSNLLSNLREKILSLQDEKNKISKSQFIDEYLYGVLKELMVPKSVAGYMYLIDSIKIVYRNKLKYASVTKEIYPKVSKKYKTTVASVERAIRHAIECSWKNCDKKILEKYFYINAIKNRRPTNYDFIFEIAQHIKTEVDKKL